MSDLKQIEIDRAYMLGIIDAEKAASLAITRATGDKTALRDDLIDSVCREIARVSAEALGKERLDAAQRVAEGSLH